MLGEFIQAQKDKTCIFFLIWGFLLPFISFCLSTRGSHEIRTLQEGVILREEEE